MTQEFTNSNNGLNLVQDGAGHRITWSNLRIRKSRTLVFGYLTAELITLTLAIFLTSGFIRDLIRTIEGARLGPNVLLVSGLFMAAAWAAAILFSLTLVRVTWTETISIQPDAVEVRSEGLLARAPKVIESGEVWRISYEKIQTRKDRDTRFTVNIFHQEGRESVGFWMRPAEKKILFNLLERAIASQGWPYVDFRFSERPGQARDEFRV